MNSKPTASPFAKRLRSIRTDKGLSQKELGILAGIDEFSASPRINQYETGKHVPDFATASRLANVLSIPVIYLYAVEDDIADLVLLFDTAKDEKKREVILILKDKD